MKESSGENAGFSIHCHHAILVDYCYDYRNRVNSIRTDKPKEEQEIRLRLFKLLPEEAVNNLPERFKKACTEWVKARAEMMKVVVESKKAYVEKVFAEGLVAAAEWDKAYAEWSLEAREAFHKKWCGCKKWNGCEIVFQKEASDENSKSR